MSTQIRAQKKLSVLLWMKLKKQTLYSNENFSKWYSNRLILPKV